jgi:hypothetical protein
MVLSYKQGYRPVNYKYIVTLWIGFYDGVDKMNRSPYQTEPGTEIIK